jgi:hypothetical protein
LSHPKASIAASRLVRALDVRAVLKLMLDARSALTVAICGDEITPGERLSLEQARAHVNIARAAIDARLALAEATAPPGSSR